MSSNEVIAGIDLGTTNSEIAAYKSGSVSVLGPSGNKLLPSCVGFSQSGELLVGQSARNQQLLFPDQTVRSIKRKMGTVEQIQLNSKNFSPQEISAFILRELVEWAKKDLDCPVNKAVITVPAYFSDAQRNATREAGSLAGLEVVRIINEPTAASLAYGYGQEDRETIMVYDLGGGTFDVSIVTLEKGVTEVLASHGNNLLGGDDFNDLLLNRLVEEFNKKHGVDIKAESATAFSRLWWAAEQAKKKLSFEPYCTVREEGLLTAGSKPLNFELQLSREEYENLIQPKVESTMESVTRTLSDANLQTSDLDAVVLVGGSTRTPLVQKIITERTDLKPHREIHPDLCVSLGAGILASRHAGEEIEQVLVDISPYSFGPSYLGEMNGELTSDCYHPIVERNLPLPVTRTEQYTTSAPYQTAVNIDIYQGEDRDARKNTFIGNFVITGLTPMEEPNEILCRMKLDINGVLHVEAIEKETGKSKQIIIKNAFNLKSKKQMTSARNRIDEFYSTRGPEPELQEIADDFESDSDTDTTSSHQMESIKISETGASREKEVEKEETSTDSKWLKFESEANKLVERVRKTISTMHNEDKEDAIELEENILKAIKSKDSEKLSSSMDELKELLFFIEGS